MTTDFRALCAELADRMDSETAYRKPDGTRWTHPAVARAGAALATRPPEPPTDEELDSLWDEEAGYFNLYEEARIFARAALERWGQ